MKHIYLKLFILFFCLAPLFPNQARAQTPAKILAKIFTAPGAEKQDSVPPRIPRTDVKPYATVIKKGTLTKKGLFTVHQLKDQLFFEIPDSLLGREMMVINRLSKTPGGYGVYAGETLDSYTRTIRFSMGHDSTIRIHDVMVIAEADTADQINKAVSKSAADPVIMSFPIKAFGEGKKSFVIETTKLVKEKSFINFIDPASKLGKNVSAPILKDITLEAFEAYPLNVELTTSKSTESKLPNMPPGTMATIEVKTSFIVLPKIPMQRRYKDARVGYFADYFHAFSDDQQKVSTKEFILRWRMEPKPEDVERYKKGELVEPAKPIIIYIDPATPKQWRPYLIQGINDWQKGFEQAGFKNAIIGKEWPENDSTMNMDDARYSLVRYLPSEIANAYGPNIHDPRSGEIIQTNVGWYHNVMSLLHDWYLIQAGAVDPEARKPKFSDELMGKLIRFVSSHEIGHTLGLRHNFFASSQTPTDSLRNSNYLKKYGHTSSIMDYARFNYVAQPEDKIAQTELFPRIGEYDTWAIEWGYRKLYAGDALAERKILNQMIAEQVKPGSRRYWIEPEINKKNDPRSQTEDIGDNPMKAGSYGIKNLKRIMPKLPQWSLEEGDFRENLSKTTAAVTQQYIRYINHVINLLGSNYYDTQTGSSLEDTYGMVPKAKQKEALAFFGSQVFTTPHWLLANAKKLDQFNAGSIEDIQVRVLNTILDRDLLEKQRINTNLFGNKAYPINEYLNDVHQLIWNELKTPQKINIDSYHRNLQKTYLGNMLELFLNREPDYSDTDIHSVVTMELAKIDREINASLKKQMLPMVRYHLLDMKTSIKKALDAKQ